MRHTVRQLCWWAHSVRQRAVVGACGRICHLRSGHGPSRCISSAVSHNGQRTAPSLVAHVSISVRSSRVLCLAVRRRSATSLFPGPFAVADRSVEVIEGRDAGRCDTMSREEEEEWAPASLVSIYWSRWSTHDSDGPFERHLWGIPPCGGPLVVARPFHEVRWVVRGVHRAAVAR